MDERGASIDERIWQVVSAIPPGRVASYGQVAARAGLPGAARRVGAALRALPPDTRIPWHRVINARGRISLPGGSHAAARQRRRLRDEGVVFSARGAVSPSLFVW